MNALYKRLVFRNAAKVAHLTYQIGESDLLRKKSKEVNIGEIKSGKIQVIISKLKKTLLKYKKLTGKGKGITAVQIGIPLQIAVLYIKNQLVTIVNPKIIKKSGSILLYPEICMSANPIIARVLRPEWAIVEYFDESGNKKIWRSKKDLIANRVLQHEINHMEGIINIDLINSRDLILDSDPDYFKKAKFEKIPQTNKKIQGKINALATAS